MAKQRPEGTLPSSPPPSAPPVKAAKGLPMFSPTSGVTDSSLYVLTRLASHSPFDTFPVCGEDTSTLKACLPPFSSDSSAPPNLNNTFGMGMSSIATMTCVVSPRSPPPTPKVCHEFDTLASTKSNCSTGAKAMLMRRGRVVNTPRTQPLFPPFTTSSPPRYGTHVADCALEVRLGFVRKVFAIVAAQLLCTIAVTSAVFLSPSLRLFVHERWDVVSSRGLFHRPCLRA